MQIERAYQITAKRDDVWSALNDAEVLQNTIPGCKKINWTSNTTLEVLISVNLGVAQPKFTGVLELSNIEPAVSYSLTGHGKGGIFGKAQGHADVSLSDLGESTRLAFTAGGSASGQLQRLGASLLGAGANRLIDGFFTRFGNAMQAEVTPIETGDE